MPRSRADPGIVDAAGRPSVTERPGGGGIEPERHLAAAVAIRDWRTPTTPTSARAASLGSAQRRWRERRVRHAAISRPEP